MISWENPWEATSGFFGRVRTFPYYLVWSLVGFVSGWVQTRQTRYLLVGVPALVLSFLVVALTLQSRQGLDSETIRRYVATAQQLLQKDQVDQAEFYMNRLKHLGYHSDPMLTTRAEIATRRDRPDLAELCYRDMLTNSDHSQDALAHYQLGLRELKLAQDPHSKAASQAIHHFQQTLETNPGSLSSHELLAKLYLMRGDLTSVALHMEPVAQAHPAFHIDLARVYEKLERHSKKADSAAQAELFFAQAVTQLESTPSSEAPPHPQRAQQHVAGYLNWSESLVMQGKLDGAVKIVTQAIEAQDSPELRRRLASIYIRQVNDLPKSTESWQKRWDLVTLSRNYDPDAREALVILADIAAHAPFELRLQAKREIQPYLDSGQAPPAAYYLVGTAAAEGQQWDTALKLLRQSVKIEPRADIAWNNLAHALYSQTLPDWEEAERCVNEAIRLNPTPPIYHETRGQIMVGRERWAEAIRELELALRDLPPEARIHQGLATAYFQLGDEDLAEYHHTRHVALSQR